MRLIDADKLMWRIGIDSNDRQIFFVTGKDIDEQPTIEAAPVVHGRLEWDTEDIYKCSNCAEKSHVKEVMGHPDWDYCPNCGAMMDGGVSDG